MIARDSIEAAYCFFHQKWRVYKFSNSSTQKDDIEYAIASYVAQMSRELYNKLANGKKDFLTDHRSFANDMKTALEQLENEI